MREFPPVVKYLFDRAFDRRTGRLRKAKFSFGDVQEAIAETGSRLHWVREDTFLAEIARSRRVHENTRSRAGRRLLHRAARRGRGDRHVRADWHGRDVGRQGHASSSHGRHPLRRRIRLPPIHYRNLKKTLSAFLSAPDVASSIWGSIGASATIQGTANGTMFGRGDPDSTMVVVRKGARSKGSPYPVLTCRAATLPNKARIAKVARQNSADEVTVLVSATSRHIVAIRFDCREKPSELLRVTFELGQ